VKLHRDEKVFLKIRRVFPKFREARQPRRFYASCRWLKSFEPDAQRDYEKGLDMTIDEVSTDRLTTDLKRVVRDSEELLKAMTAEGAEKALDIRQRLSDTLEAAKRTYERLEQKAIKGAKATDKVIRDHPYQSIGIALGIGLLVGVLSARKCAP
jgi:ElaB/YqjD/DUF883 family membrane-anchored ribosome-binding protein